MTGVNQGRVLGAERKINQEGNPWLKKLKFVLIVFCRAI